MDEIQRLIRDMDERIADLEVRLKASEATISDHHKSIGRLIGILEKTWGIRQ